MTGLSLINDTIIARSLEDKGRSYLDPAMFVIQGNPASQNGARRNDGGRGTREDLAERLDIELRRLSRALTMLDVLQGKLLSEIKKKGGEILGYTRILNYAREELGIGERSAQDLLRMESLFPKFPLFKAAYEKGELSRSKVKLLLRYLTPEDEGMWLENATGWSVRMLEDCLRLYKSTLSELLASRATGEPAENVSGEAPGVIAPANGPDETSIAEEAAQGPKSLAKGEAPESGANGKTSQKKAREWAAEQACLKSQEPATCSPVLDDEDDV
ncbi:MAG: hypothetical protein HYU64_20260, partial [Armatimonadetes bacterium]|nr:hypothetical protein [Armatimonadota bacterium]